MSEKKKNNQKNSEQALDLTDYNSTRKNSEESTLAAEPPSAKKENEQPSKDGAAIEKEQKDTAKKILSRIGKIARIVFIDGMSGMTLGLFATLIIGTILDQIGKYTGRAASGIDALWMKNTLAFVGGFLSQAGVSAQILMGAGIGAGVAHKFKHPPLICVSAAVAGMIGAHAVGILSVINSSEAAVATGFSKPGEPVGAFAAAIVAVFVGRLVSGKTKVDIIVTPIVTIVSGAVVGLLLGPPVSAAMSAIGSAITWAGDRNVFVMSALVSLLMGVALTSPISSAALGISLELSGLVAGAATAGCCAQMVGFAAASFRENKWGGVASQGVGTSMLQMPNIAKKPIIWLPAIITSTIMGPISACVFGMVNDKIGSGMGTAGLVGPLRAFETMTAGGTNPWFALLQILLVHIVLPAAICLGLSEAMRKGGWLKKGDLKL